MVEEKVIKMAMEEMHFYAYPYARRLTCLKPVSNSFLVVISFCVPQESCYNLHKTTHISRFVRDRGSRRHTTHKHTKKEKEKKGI